jgi:hypothetical protein
MNMIELGILGFTILMLVGCIVVLFNIHLSWKRVYRREVERNREFEQCRNELELLASGSLGVGRRVERFGRELNWVREQIELLAQPRVEHTSYDQVARLAGQGTDAKGLVSVFGISEAEAELVVKLNPDRKESRTPKRENKPVRHH